MRACRGAGPGLSPRGSRCPPVPDRRVSGGAVRPVRARPTTLATDQDRAARGMAIVAATGARYRGARPGRSSPGRQVLARVTRSARSPTARSARCGDEAHADPLRPRHGARRDAGRCGGGCRPARPTGRWDVLLERPWPDGGGAVADLVANPRGLRTLRRGRRSGPGSRSSARDGRTATPTTGRCPAPRPRPGRARRRPGRARRRHLPGLAAASRARSRPGGRRPAGAGLRDHRRGRPTRGPGRAGLGRTAQPQALTSSGGSVLVAVPSALLAVLDFGQRLDYAVDGRAAGRGRAQATPLGRDRRPARKFVRRAGGRVAAGNCSRPPPSTSWSAWAVTSDEGPEEGYTGADAPPGDAAADRRTGTALGRPRPPRPHAQVRRALGARWSRVGRPEPHPGARADGRGPGGQRPRGVAAAGPVRTGLTAGPTTRSGDAATKICNAE